MSLTIIKRVKQMPDLPYEKIKNTILGKQYELSLHIVGTARATSINRQTRQKTYAPNVLSLPYTTTVGDIILCPAIAQREASDWHMTPTGYIGFLFIHGLLHLKGHDHGTDMENLEKKYIRQFKLV